MMNWISIKNQKLIKKKNVSRGVGKIATNTKIKVQCHTIKIILCISCTICHKTINSSNNNFQQLQDKD